MAGILESCRIRRENDVAEQGNFGVAKSGSVYCSNHRHFDIQKIAQQFLSFPICSVPIPRSPLRRACGGSLRSRKCIARSGEDDDSVFPVASNVGKCTREFFVWTSSPLKGTAVGVEGHLEDAVLSLESDVLVAACVFFQRGHVSLPYFT